MKNQIKKIKFRGGGDASRMLVRKLLNNFFKEGRITTTEKRIMVLRSQAEIAINKAKRNTQSDKNYLLSKLADRKTLEILTAQIAPVFKSRVGGYVRVIKLARRDTDGAKIARLEWTEPVVIEKKQKQKAELETKVKTEKVTVKKKAISKKTVAKKSSKKK